MLANVVTPATLTLSKFVCPSTSKSALQSIPFLAVIIPTESILVTSSYVNVPPIVTFPLNVPSVAVIEPVTSPSIGPTNLVAVIIPTR